MGGRGGRRRAPPAIAGGGRAPLAPPTYMLLVMPACTCACIHRGGGARRSRALPALALYRLPLATALSRSLASLTPAHLLTSARLPTSLLLLHSPTILSPALWEGRAICTARLSQIGEIYYGGNDFPAAVASSPFEKIKQEFNINGLRPFNILLPNLYFSMGYSRGRNGSIPLAAQLRLTSRGSSTLDACVEGRILISTHHPRPDTRTCVLLAWLAARSELCDRLPPPPPA